MKLISPHWETSRLRISASAPDEAERLCAIFNACCATVEAWDETFHRVPPEETRELIEKGAAGFVDNDSVFAMRTMRLKDDDEIVGYFHCYHGLPRPDVLFLSMMVIDPARQQQRLGSEASRSLIDEARLLGYEAIWMRVALKNWPALRHWMNAGFRTMLEWRGDRIHTESGYAGVILEQKLLPQQNK
jgi:ribosomal protein S18 acetylase RimI-like enzyme